MCWILFVLAAVRTLAADSYRLDSHNTKVSFEVERFGIRWVTAHFADVSGNFVFDRGGSASRVDVRVGTASVECDDPRWNERLRSKEWLDVQQFPQMIFHSKRIDLADGHATATGDLTLHGLTRPVVLDVNLLNCSNTSAPGAKCEFAAHGRIKRSEYGLPHGFWTGGDQVDIAFSGRADNVER